MHLNGEVVPGVNEFDQNGKLLKYLAVASQDAEALVRNVFPQRPPGKRTVGDYAGAVRVAGQFPRLSQAFPGEIFMVIRDELRSAPDVILTGRISLRIGI
jgi:hypothetical protein